MDGAVIPVTVDGLTVRMRPCGWVDFVGIPREFDRIIGLPLGTPAEDAAFADALVAFGERLDAYAVDPYPRPSMVPPRSMLAFLGTWMAGVRDAAVDPPSADGSPKPSSTSEPVAAA